MASEKIVKYKASWHSKDNKGIIDIKFESGGTEDWRGRDPAEFCAILGVLNSVDDPYLTSNGWISTGVEDPDD